MLRTYPRLRKVEEILFGILHKVNVTICFSANVRKSDIAYSAEHVQVSLKIFPITPCEWKITTAHPILLIIFKNILRTFEDEILKNHNILHPHAAQNLDLLMGRRRV